MIFNEIYSAYYNAVAKIIEKVTEGKCDERELGKIIDRYAFGESMLTLLPSLKSEKWQFITKDFKTPVKRKPTMPLTDIQKMWLKAVLLDPRIKLFDIEIPSLSNVEPLFTPEDYRIYDKYADGDPVEDEEYVKHFRTILCAIKNGLNVKIEMTSRKGKTLYVRCKPICIEYSEKDDKFRVITTGCPFIKTVNIARITKCRIYEGEGVRNAEPPEEHYETMTLKVRDERNALERCMLHFAHFEKRAERVGENYLVHIKFNKDDEPEMVIRVLSFGPMVEALAPQDFREKIIEKLKKQKICEL